MILTTIVAADNPDWTLLLHGMLGVEMDLTRFSWERRQRRRAAGGCVDDVRRAPNNPYLRWRKRGRSKG
jgi:hypothetical protein